MASSHSGDTDGLEHANVDDDREPVYEPISKDNVDERMRVLVRHTLTLAECRAGEYSSSTEKSHMLIEVIEGISQPLKHLLSELKRLKSDKQPLNQLLLEPDMYMITSVLPQLVPLLASIDDESHNEKILSIFEPVVHVSIACLAHVNVDLLRCLPAMFGVGSSTSSGIPDASFGSSTPSPTASRDHSPTSSPVPTLRIRRGGRNKKVASSISLNPLLKFAGGTPASASVPLLNLYMINYFGEHGGFETLLKVIKKGDGVTLPLLRQLLQPIVLASPYLSPACMQSLGPSLSRVVFSFFLDADQARIKAMARHDIADVIDSVAAVLVDHGLVAQSQKQLMVMKQKRAQKGEDPEFSTPDQESIAFVTLMQSPRIQTLSNASARAHIERFFLDLALSWIRSPFLDKRIAGLNEIKDTIALIMAPPRKESPATMGIGRARAAYSYFVSKTPEKETASMMVPTATPRHLLGGIQWLTADFVCQWLLENQVVEEVLSSSKTHLELVRRVGPLLALLQRNDQLAMRHVELVWALAASEQHESMEHLAYEIAADLCAHLNLPLLDALFAFIAEKPVQSYTPQLLALLKRLTLRAWSVAAEMNLLSAIAVERDVFDGAAFNGGGGSDMKHWYGLRLCWDAMMASELPTSISDICSSTIVSLLASKHALPFRMHILENCVVNLRRRRSLKRTCCLMQKVIELYPVSSKSWFGLASVTGSSGTLRSSLIERLEQRFNVVDRVLEDMADCQAALLKRQGIRHNSSAPSVFLESGTTPASVASDDIKTAEKDNKNSDLLRELLILQDFVVFLLTNSSLALHRAQLDRLWLHLVEQAPSAAHADSFFGWLLGASRGHSKDITAASSGSATMRPLSAPPAPLSAASAMPTASASNQGIHEVFSNADLSYLLTSKMLKLAPYSLSEVGFSLIEHAFVVTSKTSFALRVDPLIGFVALDMSSMAPVLKFLWDVTLRCRNDAIATRAQDIQAQIYTNMSIRSRGRATAHRRGLVRRCLRFLRNSSSSSDTDHVARDRCLRLLRTFVDATSRVGDDLDNSASSGQIKIRVVPAGPIAVDPFDLTVNRNLTIGGLLTQVARRLHRAGVRENHITLQWVRVKRTLNLAGARLGSIGMLDGDVVSASVPVAVLSRYAQRPSAQVLQPIVAYEPLSVRLPTNRAIQAAQHRAIQTRNSYMKRTDHALLEDSVSDPALPALTSASAAAEGQASQTVDYSVDWFECLMSIMESRSSSNQARRDAWLLLSRLPLHTPVLSSLLALDRDWPSLLVPFGSAPRCRYVVQIVMTIVCGWRTSTTPSPLKWLRSSSGLNLKEADDDAACLNWISAFVQSGGVDFLFETISTNHELLRADGGLFSLLLCLLDRVLGVDPSYRSGSFSSTSPYRLPSGAIVGEGSFAKRACDLVPIVINLSLEFFEKDASMAQSAGDRSNEDAQNHHSTADIAIDSVALVVGLAQTVPAAKHQLLQHSQLETWLNMVCCSASTATARAQTCQALHRFASSLRHLLLPMLEDLQPEREQLLLMIASGPCDDQGVDVEILAQDKKLWNDLLQRDDDADDEIVQRAVATALRLLVRRVLDLDRVEVASRILQQRLIALPEHIGDPSPGPRRRSLRRALFSLILDIVDRSSYETVSSIVEALYEQRHSIRLIPRTGRRFGYHPYLVQRSDSTVPCGLKNQGATCYMNALLQLLFLTPSFRKAILFASPDGPAVPDEDEQADGEDKREPTTTKAAELDDILMLKELQNVYANLMVSSRRFHDTIDFCSAFRDRGEPVRVSEQRDVHEFSNQLFDKLESVLELGAGTCSRLGGFGGSLVNQMISLECPHGSEREEAFYMASMPVQNKANLAESMSLFVQGDRLDGDNKWMCDECNCKVAALKRVCFKADSLPDRLVLHLKRFEFDFDTMTKIKLNGRFEFPDRFSILPFTDVGLADESAHQEPDQLDYTYELYGILVHTGVADAGHYYSFASDSSGSWWEYNDALVCPFETTRIDAECFGGAEENNPDTPKCRSAYMLFYQRVQKCQEASALEEPALSDCEKQDVADLIMPQTVADRAWHQNAEFLRDRQIYDYDFMRCMFHMLSVAFQDDAFQGNDDSSDYPLQLGVEYVFAILVRSADCASVPQWLWLLQTRLRKSPRSSRWLLRRCVDEFDWFLGIAVHCVAGNARLAFVDLLLLATQTCLDDQDSNPDSTAAQDAVDALVDALLDSLPGLAAQKLHQSCSEAMLLLKGIGMLDSNVLLRCDVIPNLLRFVVRSNITAGHWLMHALETIEMVLRRFHTPSSLISKEAANSSLVEMDLQLLKRLLSGVVSTGDPEYSETNEGCHFWVWAMRSHMSWSGERCARATEKIAQRFARNDGRLSKRLVDACLHGLLDVSADPDRLDRGACLRILDALLTIDDGLALQRVNHALDGLSKVMEIALGRGFSSGHLLLLCSRFLTKHAFTTPHVAAWLRRHEQWRSWCTVIAKSWPFDTRFYTPQR